MTRFAATPAIFKQSIAPDQTSDIIPTDGDIWVDRSSNPPIVKKCTTITPYTWVSIEGGGGGTPNFADEETPSGLVNGTNTTFTLVHSPSPAPSLMLHVNGLMQQQGSGKDYTLSGATITMSVAPITGDTILAWYRF